MPTIRLTRTDEFINRFRDYGIYVDDAKRGTVSNGKTIEIEVAPGTHTLTAKIDWTSSPAYSFTIGETGTLTFKVGGFKEAQWVLPLTLIFMIAGPVIEAKLHFEYLYLLSLLPLFLILVYYLTIGRKRYLSLAEEPRAKQRANNINPAQTVY